MLTRAGLRAFSIRSLNFELGTHTKSKLTSKLFRFMKKSKAQV